MALSLSKRLWRWRWAISGKTLRHFSERQDTVRVRFAPSPTGMLHLGGLRTALYNYLFAKSHGGSFILRIEDTDQERLVPAAVGMLEEMLLWCNLVPDEGPSQGGSFGPYLQSERMDLYQKHVDELVKSGHAYRCFCSAKRLELLRKEAVRVRQVPGYDNRCRHLTDAEIDKKLSQNQPYVIRFKYEDIPHSWEDMVYGTMRSAVSVGEGDFVISKSDKFPTYHFANIVDDHYMAITHVLRGEEWQVSTPKHLQLYKAFNWEPPKYAHLPLLLDSRGKKLSKRHGVIDVDAFKRKGYFPDALLNYITTVGGGFTESTAGATLSDLVKLFQIESVCSHSGRLQPSQLEELNRIHLQRAVGGDDKHQMIQKVRDLVTEKLHSRLQSSGSHSEVLSDDYIDFILNWAKVHRVSKVEELVESHLEFIWVFPDADQLRDLIKVSPHGVSTLSRTVQQLQKMETFTETTLKEVLKCYSKENGLKFSAFMIFLREALSGLKEGPSVAEMMSIIGKSETLRRLQHTIEILGDNS